MGIKPGVDGGLFREHLDAKRWEEWTNRPANIHEGACTAKVRNSSSGAAPAGSTAAQTTSSATPGSTA